MPTKSRFSAFGKPKSYKPKTIPLVNPKKPQSPAEALYASVAIVGGIVEQLHKLYNGPMAQAPDFFKGYIAHASKYMSDLLRQLSDKLGTMHQLDAVAASAVELLDVLAEYDEDGARELADSLTKIHGTNQLFEQLFDGEEVLATLKHQSVEIVEEGIRVSGLMEVEREGVTAVVEFDEIVPIQALDPRLKELR